MINQQNKYDWNELTCYLEAYVQAEVDRCMSDPDFYNDPEINWDSWDARVNVCERLEDSIKTLFSRELTRLPHLDT